MRDFQLGWFEKLQPLGRALTSHRTDADCAKTRAIIDLHNARYDFEHIDHDEPAVAPPAQPADHAARANTVEDGWIPWAGGECPVAPGTRVEVRMRVPGHCSMVRGRDFSDPKFRAFWGSGNRGMGNDIVAYRIAA